MAHITYISLYTSQCDVDFFHHSVFLTHVQSVIQIPLVLVGRSAVKFAFSNHVFPQLITPDKCGVFGFLLLNCILLYAIYCQNDLLVLLLLYILLSSFL